MAYMRTSPSWGWNHSPLTAGGSREPRRTAQSRVVSSQLSPGVLASRSALEVISAGRKVPNVQGQACNTTPQLLRCDGAAGRS
jgi:hypothetical protein